MEKQVTRRWDTLNCYNPNCQHIPLYRCAHYAKCGQEGCSEHMPETDTIEGKKRLCGECRILRSIVYGEPHF